MSTSKEKAYEVLDKLEVEYEKYEHEPIYTIEEAEELDKRMGLEICKNLFMSTRHSTEFYLILMPGSKRFNSGKVSKQLKVPRMTFAKDEYLLEYLGLLPGSVTPLGLIQDTENVVNFIIDKDVMDMDKIAIHPCINTETVIIKLSDLIEKILPYTKHTYKVIEIE